MRVLDAVLAETLVPAHGVGQKAAWMAYCTLSREFSHSYFVSFVALAHAASVAP